MVKRQSTPPIALKRCGEAEPSVRAPTRMATSKPRSSFAQLATILIPTGYTLAIHIPVMKRAIYTQALSGATNRMEALADAATRAETINKMRGSIRSARPRTALRSVPATNPTCTLLVNIDTCVGVSACSSRTDGTTDVAENHTARAASSQIARRPIETALDL